MSKQFGHGADVVKPKLALQHLLSNADG